jgi:hypothetical protein
MVFVAPPVPRPVLRAILLSALVAALALAGCSGKDPPSDGRQLTQDGMTIVGLVQNETYVPVPGAQVSLRMTDHVVTTDEGGLFTFHGLPLSPYLVDVVADGFENATLNAEPVPSVSLSFILVRPVPAIPEPVVLKFTGYYECAFEALIIPGSCDRFMDGSGQDVFDNRSTFFAPLGARWSTAVVDVDFDPHPGLDGLRVTMRAKSDRDDLGTYEQYGRFNGPESFSFRIEPGATYPDGVRPMPANATALQLDVYPHGHGWHAACSDPLPPDAVPEGSCPLGVGTARDVVFDIYVTVFFVDPAPEGYTLLA